MAVVVSQLVGRISIEGSDQAQNNLKQVGTAATNLSEKLQTIKPFNAGNTVSDVDVAQAKLTLLESKVSDAREKLQTLQDAADAGKSVKGIPEAQANLILLQEKAQQARAGLQELQSGGEEANAGLQQVDEGAQEASSGLSGLLSRLQETAGEMAGNFLSSVKESVSNLGGGLLGGIKDVAGNLAGGFLGGIKSAVGGIGDFINGAGQMAFNLQNLWNMSTQVASALLTPAMSAETMKTAFTTLMGSTKAATDEMAKLDAFASKTPFTTLDIDKAASQLIGFGTNAKDVIPDLTAIGDALSAVGRGSSGDLNMIVDIFGKIQTEGGLSVGTMQELSRDGINAWAIMEQQTGKTKEQLTKMIQGGLIPAKDAINDLTKGIEKNPLYAGGMAKQSATMTGILSTLKSNWNQMLAAFGSPILKATEPLLAQLGSDLASPGFKAFAAGVGQGIINAFNDIGKAASWVGGIFKSLNLTDFKEAWKAFEVVLQQIGMRFDEVGKRVKPVKEGIDPLAATIHNLVQGGLNTLSDILWKISEGFVNVDKATRQGKGPLVEIENIFKDIKPTVMALWPEVQKFVKALMDFSGPVNLVQALARHSQDLGKWWQTSVVPALKEAQPHFASLGDALGRLVPMFERLGTVVHNNFQKTFDALLPVFEKAMPIIIKVSGLIADGLGKAIIFATPYVEQITKALSDFGREIAERVAPIVSKWLTEFDTNLNNFLKLWKTVWPYLAPFVEGVWDEIRGVIKIAWELVAGIIKIGLDILGGNWKQAWTDFKDMLGGIWDGIKIYLQGAWKIIQGMFNDAWKGIQAIFNPVGKWFQDRWKDIQNAFGNVSKWFQDQFTGAKNGTTSGFGDIGKWFQDRWHDIQNVFAGIGKWFQDRWNEIVTPLKPVTDFIGSIFQTINNIIQRLMQIIVGWLNDRWNDIKNAVGAAWDWVSSRISQAWDTIYKAVSDKLTLVKNWINDRWTEIKNAAGAAWGWVSSNVSQVWTNIYNTVSSKVNQVRDWIGARWNDVKNTTGQIWSQITSTIGNWWDNIFKTTNDKSTNVKNNIFTIFGSIRDGIGGIMRGFVNAIIDQFNNAITGVNNFGSGFATALNNLAKAIGAQGVAQPLRIGLIPHYATGTPSGGHPGGPMIVGEEGPELLVAPPGTAVMPHDKTRQILHNANVPGYAGGVGDIASNIFNWIAGGAQSVLNNLLSASNISAPNLGGFSNWAGAIFDKVKSWALSWIEGILPKFSFGGAGGSAVNVPGNVQSWIAAAMSLTGVPSSWAGALATIAMHESGGNPAAVNNWDINAKNGDPSRGLFQTIGSTFAAYMVPGHGNILNPIDNAAAAIRYIQSRYGSVFNVPGIVSMSHGGPYQGYANGTDYAPGGWAMVGERGPEMMYIPRGAQVIPNNRIGQASSSAAGQGATIILELNGRQFARAVLPDLTNTIRYGVGTIGM